MLFECEHMLNHKCGRRISPDGHDEAVGFHLGRGNDVPAEPDAISVLNIGPAVFELVVLCLVHVGGMCGAEGLR